MTLSAALATSLSIGFPGASSGEPMALDFRQLPGLKGFEMGRTDDGSQNLAVLRGAGGDIALTDPRAVVDRMGIGFSSGPSLRIPSGEAGARISTSGMEISLRGKPISEATCDWIDAMESIKLNDVVVSLPASGAFGVSGLSLSSFSFQASDATSPCAMVGVVTVNDLKMTMQDGSGIVFDRAAFRIALPQIGEAAAPGRAKDDRSEMSGLVIGFEYRRSGEVPAFGFPETEVRFSAVPESLAPMTALVERIVTRKAPVAAALDGMQAWNVLTEIDGSLALSAPILRIYAPGVVPSEMVANFSRAGLSTVSGGAGLSIELSDRLFELGAEMSLTGLMDASASITGAFLPYVKEKLESAASGRDLGWHLLPEIIVETGSLAWTDRGLDRAVIDITGVPAGRQLEDFAAIASSRQGDAVSILLGGIASFLRLAADGAGVVAKLEPQAPQRLASLLFGLLTDPLGMAGTGGLSLSR